MGKIIDRGRSEDVRGYLCKAAHLETSPLTEEDLARINMLAIDELSAEDVFTFKIVMCDNEVDRAYDRFTSAALTQLANLYDGKTVIKDHIRKADNQVGRIYKTEVRSDPSRLIEGEAYSQLVGYVYMVKTDANADLIKEIRGGIKKECSVGFRCSGAICSICGTDNCKDYCLHWGGRTYEKDGEEKLCTFTLTGASDAYELSLVAVPAQRAAATTKSYNGNLAELDDTDEVDEPDEAATAKAKAQSDAETLRVRLSKSKNDLLRRKTK